MRRPTTPPRRLGFTMVELLVVILVLVILMGLLIPAVMRAVGTTKEAAVAAEINLMVQGLADFKNRYGVYPPSRILVCENGDYSDTTLKSIDSSGYYLALKPRSVNYLRRIFPGLLLNTTAPGAVSGIPGPGHYDFNGNYDPKTNPNPDPPYVMEGPECLTFFLGGIPQAIADSTGKIIGYGVTGFANNPKNPMQSMLVTAARTAPIVEFKPGRLVDLFPLGVGKQNGILEYQDSLGGNVYAYFSAYEGAGYDPDDTNIIEADDAGASTNIVGVFMTANSVNQIASPTPHLGRLDFVVSSAPNPYLADTPIPLQTNGNADSGNYRPRVYLNPNTYQIISAGHDGKSGIGGQYVANGTGDQLPMYLYALLQVTGLSGSQVDPSERGLERDNVTNFSRCRLE